jgi:hypothetical protein
MGLSSSRNLRNLARNSSRNTRNKNNQYDIISELPPGPCLSRRNASARRLPFSWPWPRFRSRAISSFILAVNGTPLCRLISSTLRTGNRSQSLSMPRLSFYKGVRSRGNVGATADGGVTFSEAFYSSPFLPHSHSTHSLLHLASSPPSSPTAKSRSLRRPPASLAQPLFTNTHDINHDERSLLASRFGPSHRLQRSVSQFAPLSPPS